jgi:hypothetical protein
MPTMMQNCICKDKGGAAVHQRFKACPLSNRQ